MFEEVVESTVELAPCVSQRAALSDIRRERGVEEGEARREDSAMCLGEQDANAPSEWRELIAMRTWQPSDQRLAAKSAKVIGGLVTGVRLVPEATDQLDQLAVVEAVEGMREEHQCREQGHHSWIAEGKRRSVEAVCGCRRPGHVSERDHIRSRSCRLRFGVTQTSVG